MKYIYNWKELEEKKERQLIRLVNNPYNYKINICHPLVTPKFEAFKRSRNIGRYDMTDALRREFEEIFMNSRYYQKCIEQEREKFGATAYMFIELAYKER